MTTPLHLFLQDMIQEKTVESGAEKLQVNMTVDNPTLHGQYNTRPMMKRGNNRQKGCLDVSDHTKGMTHGKLWLHKRSFSSPWPSSSSGIPTKAGPIDTSCTTFLKSNGWKRVLQKRTPPFQKFCQVLQRLFFGHTKESIMCTQF